MKHLAALLLAPTFAFAATSVSDVPGPHDLYSGSHKLGSYVTHAACVDATPKTVSGKYTCRTSNTITVTVVTIPPKPADETQLVACPVGSVAGSTWTQIRTYVLTAPPANWVAGPWTPTSPPAGACPPVPPTHMHGGVQGILHDKPIIASPDGIGYAPGIDQVALSDPAPLPPAPDPANWEEPGAIRTVCKATHWSNDDAIVYPGQPGLAHDHTFFRPGTDAFLTDANVRAAGNKSTCRGGTLDLTGRWVPTMYDTVSMQAVIPGSLLVYYKSTLCSYSIPCSGASDYTSAALTNVHWPPKGMHIIGGDPNATAPAGHAKYTCMTSEGQGRDASVTNQVTIPACLAGESLWMIIDFPSCLALNADGTPMLDSPDHKSHAAYMEGWPQYNSPLPGKAYRCPSTHPYDIPTISMNVIFAILPGMDTSKWGLSCGLAYCAHGDWFDGWDQAIVVPTNVECLQKRRNCGAFNIFDGRTALEFGGN